MIALLKEKLGEEMKIRNHEGLASVITTVVAFGIIGTFTIASAAYNYHFAEANKVIKNLSSSAHASAVSNAKNNPKDGSESRYLLYAKDIQGEIGNRKQPELSKQEQNYQALLAEYESVQSQKKAATAIAAKRIVRKPVIASKGSCPYPNEKPRYSKTKGKHMDEDCCPDPDEWPNPHCSYSSGGMGVMRSSPKK